MRLKSIEKRKIVYVDWMMGGANEWIPFSVRFNIVNYVFKRIIIQHEVTEQVFKLFSMCGI